MVSDSPRAAGLVERPAAPGETQESSEQSPIDVLGGLWWVVHTKARNEKALATDLDHLGVGYFLPLARVRRRWGGRTATVRVPLFPGYLFLCGGYEERYATLMTHRAANVIEVGDQEGLRHDLRQIYRTVTGELPVDLFPGIRRGRRCRVVAGSLKGVEGVVLQRRSVCRVYVAVTILGQSAEVEIDPGLLEAVD